MTNTFPSKPLLDMGLQKSLDLEKNGFSWYIIQLPNYFSNYFLYNLNNTLPDRQGAPYSSVLTLLYTEVYPRKFPTSKVI